MLTFEDLHLKDAEDIFRKVDQACRTQGLEYYLIGVRSRQNVTFEVQGLNPMQVEVVKVLDERVKVRNVQVVNGGVSFGEEGEL